MWSGSTARIARTCSTVPSPYTDRPVDVLAKSAPDSTTTRQASSSFPGSLSISGDSMIALVITSGFSDLAASTTAAASRMAASRSPQRVADQAARKSISVAPAATQSLVLATLARFPPARSAC